MSIIIDAIKIIFFVIGAAVLVGLFFSIIAAMLNWTINKCLP